MNTYGITENYEELDNMTFNQLLSDVLARPDVKRIAFQSGYHLPRELKNLLDEYKDRCHYALDGELPERK